jgi:hypothetical protein
MDWGGAEGETAIRECFGIIASEGKRQGCFVFRAIWLGMVKGLMDIRLPGQ